MISFSLHGMIAIWYDTGENNQIDEGNSLPLCFSSFEFLKERIKIINKAQDLEFMEKHIEVLEKSNERKDNRSLYDDYTSQSENDEGGYDIINTFESTSEVGSICQKEVKWHGCHDPLAMFLQTSQKMFFLLFTKMDFGFIFSFKLQLQYQFSIWFKQN